jgi:hypothetical protein
MKDFMGVPTMNCIRYLLCGLFTIVMTTMISPTYLHAQADRGTIKGITQDASSASIAGASVTLKNDATGVTAKAVSNASGEFSFVSLLPGVYTLTVEANGFTTTVQQHVEVGVGSTVAVTLKMQAGQVQQTVTISASTASIDTQTSDIGTTITPQEIKDLPLSLNGDMRNPLNFVLLTPGVSSSTPGPGSGTGATDYRLHISGSVSFANEVYIDGIPIVNTELSGDIGNNHPAVDAIGQFKIINNNQSAQYGLSSGIVSFAFNSGANAYHGSLFENLQNDALDANTYDNKKLGATKAPLKQNEYGGTFGGPAWIPKVYSGRDKTFFFVNYTGFSFRPSSNNPTLTTIPNAYRAGNFAQALGGPITDPVSGQPIVDPMGRPILIGQVYNPLSAHTVVGPDRQPYQIRDPFPGNIIPANTLGLSTVSKTVLQSFPTATNNAINDNFFRQLSSKIDEHRFVVKIDEHINEKHSLSGSVFTGAHDFSNNGTLNLLDANQTTAPTLQIRLSYNYTHSSTLLNNLNIGFLRDKGFNGPLQPGPGLGALGIQGLPPLDPNSPFPGIGIGTAQNGIGGLGASSDVENRYILNDNVTMVRGRHTLTVGGEARWLQRNEEGIPTGSFTFEPSESALNGTGFVGSKPVAIPVGTGNAAASFLFGGMDFTRFDYPVTQNYRWWQIGGYAQDDWRVNPSLTLNLGLRYDVQVPRTETHGNVSTMDPTLPNPAAGGLLGAFTFYGKGAGRNGQTRIGNTDWKGVQPRIGFAYAPGANQRTVFRGGFAVTRPVGNDNLENGIGSGEYALGFAGLATANRASDAVGSPAYYWDRQFPQSSISGATINPGLLVGNDNPPLIYAKSGEPPMQLYWSMQMQHQLSSSVIANIGYVGMHSYHLGVWSKPNQIAPQTITQYTPAAQAAGLPINAFLALPIDDSRVQAAGIRNPWSGFADVFGSGATAGQALRPYPQYGDVDNPLNPIGSVSYNGLQSSLQKRFTQGLTFLLSYTFSKTIGNVDSNNGATAGAENAQFAGSFSQDYYNPQGDRSVTSSDIPHVVSLSYTYELPLGQGKRFLNHGGVVNKVVGGWSVSGLQQYQSGRPIHIEFDATGGSNPFFAAGDGFSFRPNIVPNQPFKNPSYNRHCSGPLLPNQIGRDACQFYINPAAFSLPAVGTFGNAPNLLSALRMPAYVNEDLSLSKRTTIHDNLNLQFQANFFNALNRATFSSGGNPQTFIVNAAPPDLSQSSLANTNTVFGIMAAQQNGPRSIQFGLRLEF